MEHKTMTTIGELRVGDRFTYGQKRVDVWQVMGLPDRKGRVPVNQLMFDNKPIYKHDEMIKPAKVVMFVRHTVPVPGEEIFLQDLKIGDVFMPPVDPNNPESILYECLVVGTHRGEGGAYWEYLMKGADISSYAGKLSKVTYLRSELPQI